VEQEKFCFPRKVQSKWQLSNGHARSCAPKLQGSGKDEKLGPMSQAPEILVYVFAVYSGIPAAKLSVLVRLIKRKRFKLVLQPHHVIAVLTLAEAYSFFKEAFIKFSLYCGALHTTNK